MSLFIETIKVQYGKIYNPVYHNARANATRREVLKIYVPIHLQNEITIPSDIGRGIYKCRVTYGTQVESVHFEKYQRTQIRTLKLVDGGTINYQYKYADRSAINTLFALREKCDDILIVKNGLITDASYANVAVFDGKQWYTPTRPLLKGTKRQQLIDEGMILERDIRVDHLKQYKAIVLFNAMMDLRALAAIEIRHVI